MGLSKRIKKLIGRLFWIPYTKRYLSKERQVNVNGISVKVPAGVFHPTLFLSTQFLLDYINSITISDLTTLELGAGSGLLAIAMAKQGAIVSASDISKQACIAVQENAVKNGVCLNVIHSDLFNNFEETVFDLVIINPPYYPRDPMNEAERAWYCGSNFEYFQSLFNQLANYIKENGKAILVLSEDCDINKIREIAIKYRYLWHQIKQKKINGEWNYLFEITSVPL